MLDPLRRAPLLLLLCLAPAAAFAATETVTLNGRTYEVETAGGNPVPVMSSDVEMRGLGPVLWTPENPESMSWLWRGTVLRSGSFEVTVTTPLDQAVSTSFELRGQEHTSRPFFDSETYPTVWAWLDAEGTSWVPFMFHFVDQATGESFDVTQWQRFDDDSKLELRALDARDPVVVEASPDKAVVYVVNSSDSRYFGSTDVLVDDMPVATMLRSSYAVFEIEPGWHLMWGSDCPPEWFEFAANRIYLVEIGAAGANNRPCGRWIVGMPERIVPTILLRELEIVTPSEESLVELRSKADGFARARRQAGEPPGSGDEIVAYGFTYGTEPIPLTNVSFGVPGRDRSLTLSKTALTYDSRSQSFEIPLAEVRAFTLVGSCLRIDHGQSQVQSSYFCPDTVASRNRVLMSLLNSDLR